MCVKTKPIFSFSFTKNKIKDRTRIWPSWLVCQGARKSLLVVLPWLSLQCFAGSSQLLSLFLHWPTILDFRLQRTPANDTEPRGRSIIFNYIEIIFPSALHYLEASLFFSTKWKSKHHRKSVTYSQRGVPASWYLVIFLWSRLQKTQN